MIAAVMPQEQTPSPSPAAAPAATMRSWWQEVSTPARAAFVCGVPLALGLGFGEAAAGDALGPEHPLALPRLALRLGCFLASGVCLAIAGVGTFRAWRRTTRLRTGLCPTCGYDLRATPRGGRCPECGTAPAEP
jgi:hypothetical protein